MTVPNDAAQPNAAQPDAAQPDEVRAARERLATLRGRPASEHAETYTAVHRLLHDALTDLDDTPRS